MLNLWFKSEIFASAHSTQAEKRGSARRRGDEAQQSVEKKRNDEASFSGSPLALLSPASPCCCLVGYPQSSGSLDRRLWGQNHCLEAAFPASSSSGSSYIISTDPAALNLLFQSAEILKTARHYEVVFLVHEDHVDQLEDVIQKVKDFIEEKKGKIHRLNDWGMRKLAYKIGKARRANYILMNIQINAKDINDFKTLLDNDERVIRHLVITMKKAETAQTTPPPEFSTVADDGFLDDEEELEENEDVEEEYDDEDAEEEDDDEGDQEIEVAKEEVVIEA